MWLCSATNEYSQHNVTAPIATESFAGVTPMLEPRRGAANISAFFESLAPLSFQRFEPHTFFADGNKVLALIAIDATHVASGKHYNFPYEGHVWFFNDAGKIVKYQHVTDTALHRRAAKGE